MRAESGGDRWPSLGRRSPEGRILRYVLLCAARRPAPLLDPVFTVGRLAGLLELDPDACRRALYALTQRGELEADVLTGGRFRLRHGPPGRKVAPGR
jgi:hypothetical protein